MQREQKTVLFILQQTSQSMAQSQTGGGTLRKPESSELNQDPSLSPETGIPSNYSPRLPTCKGIGHIPFAAI